MATHYDTLGVPKSATMDEIRRAYHHEARRWHPDRASERPETEARRAEDAMRRVNEAWRVLGDAARRRDYDRRLGRDVSARVGAAGAATAQTTGPRIDPRLLDPEYLAARRRAQEGEIDRGHAAVLRMAPWVALLGLLAGIFVVTAYARPDTDAVAPPTTLAGPSIGVPAGACVRIGTGPSLLEVPCGGVRDGVVVAVKIDPTVACPAPSQREVALPSGAIVCLAP